MPLSFIASAIQMVSDTDVVHNIATARRLVEHAAQLGSQLVVLPEYFYAMGLKPTDKIAYQETYGQGPIQNALSNMAKDNAIWLVGGTVPLASDKPQRIFNATLLFAPDGSVVCRYNKIHLFALTHPDESHCESNTLEAGTEPMACDTPLARLAFGICYDVRFPELFRALAPFDVLILPAAFTRTTGKDHWETLLRSRAIENQSYLIASAQGGQHKNGRLTHGHSMIIDPWGKILAQQPQSEGVITATIDLNYLATVRQQLPALNHRLRLSFFDKG